VLDEMGAPLEVQPGETADKVDAELNNAVVGKPSLSEDFKKTLPKVSWDPYKGGAAAAGATSTAAKAESDGGCSAGPDGRGLGAVVLAGLACLLVWRRRYV
jgi:MYXO-CTERM domain-containing protein